MFCSVFATLVLTNKARARTHTRCMLLSAHVIVMVGFRRPKCDCTCRLHLDVPPRTSTRALRQRERSGSQCALRILCRATVLHDADRCADVYSAACQRVMQSRVGRHGRGYALRAAVFVRFETYLGTVAFDRVLLVSPAQRARQRLESKLIAFGGGA